MRMDVLRLLQERLFPVLPVLLEQDRVERGIRSDSAIDEVARIFSGMAAVFGEVYSEEQIRTELLGIGGLVYANAKRETARQLGAIGIAPVTNNIYTPQLLSSFVKENVGLVKSVGADQLPVLEQMVTGAFRRGTRVEQLQKDLRAKLGLTRARASLIANDQVLKLQGEFTRVEQTNAGIRGYIWRTVKDGRVRDFHRGLEGTKQSWSKPPVVSKDGRQAHPGGDYRCRCFAEPDIDTLVLDAPQEEPMFQDRLRQPASLAIQAGLLLGLVLGGEDEEQNI